ncbi:unnamed protein product [Closterium sp. NIES-53]
MAARIASKSRSKIATFCLSRSPQRGSSTASGNWARQATLRRPKQRCAVCGSPHVSPRRPPVQRRNAAAAAGAGYHQSLHAARLHLDQLHRRHHLHHRCRCLHGRCLCLHHPHRRHQIPHSRHHPHLHRHPLRLPHRLHRRLHRPLHHPCPPCPCCCGASH